MREIVLDTETTGLDPADGHRIVEIGAIEIMHHMPTGQRFHTYVNPERDMPEAAFAVHGLGGDFLQAQPVFATIAQDFLDFVGDAPLVIHNAAFDMAFLNAELARAGLPRLPQGRAVDTLALARAKFPGAPASLDALCRRFAIDSSARTLHGALLDSEILAEVYLELIGGRQPDFELEGGAGRADAGADGAQPAWRPRPRPRPLPPRLSEAEAAAHAAFVAGLGEAALWLRGD